jgi:uncharacterized protein (TIGR02996 family)
MVAKSQAKRQAARPVKQTAKPRKAPKQPVKQAANRTAPRQPAKPKQRNEASASAPPAIDARNPDLEAAILRAPDDVNAYLVYGDWLQAQGDPRGELVALQHARLEKPKHAAPARREHEYLATHAPYLFGELVEASQIRPSKRVRWPALRADWFMGFIRSARLSWYEELETIEQLLPLVCALPSARFLRELRFGQPDSNGAVYYQRAVAQLVGLELPLTLDSLYFGDFENEDWDVKWTDIGDLTPISKRFPELRRLRVHGTNILFGELPELRELEAVTDSCSELAVIAPILAGRAPKLESLVFSAGPSRHGDLKLTDLQPLLDGKLPNLAELSLDWLDFGRELLGKLVESPLAGRLRKLRLSSTHLHDREAELLAKHRARFPALEVLDLELNYLTSSGRRKLAGYCSDLRFGTQWDPDDDFVEG